MAADMAADMVADIAAVTRWRIMAAGVLRAMRQLTMITGVGQRMRHTRTPAGA